MNLPSEFAAEVQYRAARVDSISDGTFSGRLVPYEVEIELFPGLREVFARGAFAKAVKDPARCKVMSEGHGRTVIGMATELQSRDDGLWGVFKFASTQDAQDARAKMVDGFLDELSVEFRTIRDAMVITTVGEDQVWRHKRAQLLGVSPVPHGAYGRTALVSSARSVDAAKVEKARADAQRLLAGLNA